MPTFSMLSVAEARARSATGKRPALLQEYVGYIERVGPGEAGKLEAIEGETTQAIRCRISAAAEALGKRLEFRRTDNTVYFWTSDGRRRGRPRKKWRLRRISYPVFVLLLSTHASGMWGKTSRAMYASMSSTSGTVSVSRSSGSGSGLPSRSRHISASGSRSPSADRTILRSPAVSLRGASYITPFRCRPRKDRSKRGVRRGKGQP